MSLTPQHAMLQQTEPESAVTARRVAVHSKYAGWLRCLPCRDHAFVVMI